MAADSDGGARRPARPVAADSDLRHLLTPTGESGESVIGESDLDSPSHQFAKSPIPASRLRRPPDIADKLDAGERLGLGRRRPAVRHARSARRRLARQPRAREAARRPHLLQLQHPPRGDQRLRRELPVLLVRAAQARRSRRLHDVARAGLGQAAPARPTSRSPKSTSSTACIPICRSTTTRSCCAASSASARTSI